MQRMELLEADEAERQQAVGDAATSLAPASRGSLHVGRLEHALRDQKLFYLHLR